MSENKVSQLVLLRNDGEVLQRTNVPLNLSQSSSRKVLMHVLFSNLQITQEVVEFVGEEPGV